MNNSPFYNGEFERAVREAGLVRAVVIGEALAGGIAAIGRLAHRIRKALPGMRPGDLPLTPRASAAQRFGSGD